MPHFIIYMIVTGILSLLRAVFSSGQLRIHLALARKEMPRFAHLFYGFTVRPDRFILSALFLWLLSIIVMLPAILCMMVSIYAQSIPLLFFSILLYLGALTVIILVVLRFAFVTLLLTDHPAMGVLSAYRESCRLMTGNKKRLFYIGLSYLGWFLLSLLSCYIGLLWVTPYYTQTFVLFYLEAAQTPEPVKEMELPDGSNN